MLADSAGPAGVKNLRAIFENKHSDQSTSPPSRGRSRNESVSSANSRPVSKVRTSFVAVEKQGEPGQPPQWGLRRASDVSSMAELREEATPADAGNTITPIVTNETSASTIEEGDLGAILKGSPFETSATQQFPQLATPSKAEVSDTKPADTPKMNGTSVKNASDTGNMEVKDQPTTKKEPAVKKDTSSAKATPSNINTKAAITSRSKDSPTSSKKSPILQKKTQGATPTVHGNGGAIKPRGGVSKILGVMQSANKAKEERAKTEQSKLDAAKTEKKSTPKEVKVPSVATKPTAASKAHAQKSDTTAADSTKPKSPTSTRMAKLPAAVTAPTAASAARKDANTEPEESKKHTTDRRSILSQTPRVASATTKASLAKKSSRASLANGDDTSKSRLSINHKPADESFLARMTRPTASSAQKSHEKVQISSPPRQRQTSENHVLPKKTGRKSLNLNGVKPATADEAEETTLESTTKDAPHVPASKENVNEPGPGEGELAPSQQAEELSTTS